MEVQKVALLSLLFTNLCLNTFSQMTYPDTKTVKQVDDYHGVKIEDPYRWLEDDNSPETKAWVESENKTTNQYMSQIPFREKVKDRLTALWNYDKMSTIFKKGSLFFSLRNNGLQNQAVLYSQASLTDDPKVLLDPNTLSNDGTASLSGMGISKDGKYLAYGISKAGSDWVEIHVKNILTKEDLKDVIKWVKFSDISWKGNGFYYSAYDAPKDNKAFTQKNEFHKVYYHTIGKMQSEDILVYEDKAHGDRNFSAQVTHDENYLVIYGSESTSGQSFMIKDLMNPQSSFIPVITNFDNEYGVMENIGNQFYVYTNYKAPRYKLVKISLNNPAVDNWEDILPQQEDLLEGVSFCGNKLISNYLKSVSSKLYLHSISGKMEKEIALKGICKVNAVNSSQEDNFALYSTVSYTSPEEFYFYDSRVGTSRRIFKPNTPFESVNYETKQVFYTSKDGTKVSMFITAKKGIELNGNNPCFVFGYGGFNVSYTPEFRIDRAVFLEAGGIYVVPNLRGGGEYGEDWHMNGTKCKKQNVFDDFISACDFLVENKYTSREKLAIHGRSNGGLLIGAVMTQRPDIAKVAIPTVGVLDMLRFHLFTIGRAWAVDYGSSENKEEFECLLKYSPLHNVKKAAYPATLILTGDHDDRVVPAHSFKFAATLQKNNVGKNPSLIRIDVNAGHGSGKPTDKQIAEFADMWSFVFFNLGVNY
ncbi:MAG: Family serine protease [Bacteroidota bacterium]|jgi:prolyl oligopeptidase|nr:Family serine protease [Bacteroidota bacterium]